MLIIKDGKINNFIDKLKNDFKLIDVRGEILPVKKYFFPPVQETFSLDKNSKIKVSDSSEEEFILFGLTEPSIEGLVYLDEIMKIPNEDFFYCRKRKLATIIGMTGTDSNLSSCCDVVFKKTRDAYEVFVNSPKGEKIISKHKKLFEEIEEKNSKKEDKSNNSEGWSETMRELLKDPKLLKSAVDWSFKGYPEIWERLKNECIGCGICTYVCPLCYCFSIEDIVDLEGKCSRCRRWDACTLPEFAKISGGHDFRPTIKERYYNWFYHKFVRAYLEYGKPQCVGCGACKRYCPARIDIQEVLRDIIGEYKKINGIN